MMKTKKNYFIKACLRRAKFDATSIHFICHSDLLTEGYRNEFNRNIFPFYLISVMKQMEKRNQRNKLNIKSGKKQIESKWYTWCISYTLWAMCGACVNKNRNICLIISKPNIHLFCSAITTLSLTLDYSYNIV